MDKPKGIAPTRKLEHIIQAEIMAFLTLRGWFVKDTHGNAYQSGFPDLWATHSKYGGRWIEVKCPDLYSFTAAQLETFPKFCANGTGIWVMNAATEEQYAQLFRPHNWYFYLLALGQKGCSR